MTRIRFSNILLWAVGMILLLSGCSVKKLIRTHDQEHESALEALNGNRKTLDWFDAKAAINLESGKDNKSFKAVIRNRVDSVCWMNLSVAGLSVGRTLATVDSIKMAVKFPKKQLLRMEFSMLQQRFDEAISLKMFQDALVGNPVGLSKAHEYYTDLDSGQYWIGTLPKNEVLKLEQAESPMANQVYQYWCDKQTGVLTKTRIIDVGRSAKIDLAYSNFKNIDSLNVPMHIDIRATSSTDSARMRVKFNRFRVNRKLKFPFKINDSYEVLDLQ